MIGIYIITNKQSGKFYIGKSKNIEGRFAHHKAELRHNNHYNIHLQRAWNLYGEESFVFSVLEECKEDELNDKEIHWISEFGGYKSEFMYNQTKGGDGLALFGEDNGMYGKHHTPESLLKMHIKKADSSLGSKNPMYGKHHTLKTKKKISDANKGKILSTEQKEKISRTLKEGYSKGIYKDKKPSKYTDEFMKELREEYLKCKSFKEVANKYNIPYECCRCAITFNRTNVSNQKSLKRYI